MANPTTISRPPYESALVDGKNMLSIDWLKWYGKFLVWSGTVSTNSVDIASLQTDLISTNANVSALQTTMTAVQTQLATDQTALDALSRLPLTINQHTLQLAQLATEITALQQYPTVQSIVNVTAAYTFSRLDYTVEADATSGAFTVSLPLPAAAVKGEIHNCKKIDSSSNAVTLSGNGANIDGFSAIAITYQGTSLEVQFDGTSWRLI